jgi:nicotinate phosphoribosyltransferase
VFFIASSEQIKKGKITDVYFERTVNVLKKKGIKKQVWMEVRAGSFPCNYPWAVLAGIEELVALLEGLKIDVWAMEEGTIFYPNEPVVAVSGEYTDFAVFETALLGILCQSTGIATKAARCKHAAGNRTVLSFGARRMHPGISPMIERSAFIGGCDGTSVVLSADLIHENPQGTMPHALVLVIGDPDEAFRIFDEALPEEVKRIVIVDTLHDEKYESISACKVLGKKLAGVRLDTPSSRRGDMKKIVEEIRWELNLRGYKDVKIYISGGVNEEEIKHLNGVADGYGVGTTISNARVIDFSMDIVEVEGEPFTKRGKTSGRKQVLRCFSCLKGNVIPFDDAIEKDCDCGGGFEKILKPLIKGGELKRDLPTPQQIRSFVLKQLALLPED